jgi:hypothetical protein
MYPTEYTWIKNPIPVTMSNIIALNGSTRNEKGITKLPALIQSNRGMTKLDEAEGDNLVPAYNSPKIPQLTMNEANTVRQPIAPATFLDKLLRPKPKIKNPINGNKGTNQTKFIILRYRI